jgi:hypothetical protein
MVIFSVTGALTQEKDVLIGLRHDELLPQPLPYGESATAARQGFYRTLWISFDAPDSITIREVNQIIVPRNHQLWQIEVRRQQEGHWVEDRIVAAPVGHTCAEMPLDSMTVAECEGNMSLSLLFVGTDYLSCEVASEGYCQGAAHPWHVNSLKVVSLDDVGGDGMAISSVVGDAAWRAMQQGASRYWSKRKDERLNPDPDEKNWGLIRKRGRWVLRGQLDYAAEVFRGLFAHFDIDFKPPSAIVGANEFPIPWPKLKEMLPNVRDAISSPDGKLLLALTTDKLNIYAMPGWQRLRATTILTNEMVIMVQWVDGSEIADYSRQKANATLIE